MKKENSLTSKERKMMKAVRSLWLTRRGLPAKNGLLDMQIKLNLNHQRRRSLNLNPKRKRKSRSPRRRRRKKKRKRRKKRRKKKKSRLHHHQTKAKNPQQNLMRKWDQHGLMNHPIQVNMDFVLINNSTSRLN